jgi:hypothetical protein
VGEVDTELGLTYATNPGHLRLELADFAASPPEEHSKNRRWTQRELRASNRLIQAGYAI